MRHFLIAVLCLNLMGCTAETSRSWSQPFTAPQYGMSKESLIDALGKPQLIETYKKRDNTLVVFYLYMRPGGTAYAKFPVCLINDQVAGWGKTYYEDHITEDMTKIRTR
jgi:hypothetical protein